MNFEIITSTSTQLEVKFSETLKLIGQRHSNRYTGSSVWETYFLKFGKISKKDPLGGTYIDECWYIPKGNSIKGIRLRKNWTKKSDIMLALDELKNIE